MILPMKIPLSQNWCPRLGAESQDISRTSCSKEDCQRWGHGTLQDVLADWTYFTSCAGPNHSLHLKQAEDQEEKTACCESSVGGAGEPQCLHGRRRKGSLPDPGSVRKKRTGILSHRGYLLTELTCQSGHSLSLSEQGEGNQESRERTGVETSPPAT